MTMTPQAPICGKTYYTPRRVNQFPQKMTCTKPPHEGGRHGQVKSMPAVDAEPSGTCQICFRDQQTRKGRLVLHGYKRPGEGYIIGECWGVSYAPFEVSCDRTKQFITAILHPWLAKCEARLAELQAGPASLPYTGGVWIGTEKTSRAERGYKQVTIQVARDAPTGYVKTDIPAVMRHHYSSGVIVEKGDFDVLHHPSYEELRVRLIQGKQGDIRRVKQDIADYEKKVAEWKPVPWPAKA